MGSGFRIVVRRIKIRKRRSLVLVRTGSRFPYSSLRPLTANAKDSSTQSPTVLATSISHTTFSSAQNDDTRASDV